ncbi:MAG: hypothetical protein RBS57_11160 [Desulforhabdus sp.]|nr:hypothetical protein [Desulforhabdus sp.]
MNDVSVLIPLRDTGSSELIIKYLSSMPLCAENVHITLLHIFRKASSEEELMGKGFTEEELSKFTRILERAKDDLVDIGFLPENIEIRVSSDLYPTVTDGIIDQFNKSERKFDIVIIRRRKMSKAEEFLVGDVSVKLVRALEGTSVLVLKTLK